MSQALRLQVLQYCLFVFFGAVACLGVAATLASLFGETPAEKRYYFWLTVASLFVLYTAQFATAVLFGPQILDVLFGPNSG